MSRICFVVCPIGSEGSETRKNSDQLLKHILQPVCKECDFECIRVDELNDNNSITDTILKYLENADLVIADLSNHNPNAFYELGYRTALKKPTIHIKNDVDTIPFDVAGIRTITYNLKDLDKVAEAKERLTKTIQNLKFESQETDTSANTDYNSILAEIYKIQDDLKNFKSSSDSMFTEISNIRSFLSFFGSSRNSDNDKMIYYSQSSSYGVGTSNKNFKDDNIAVRFSNSVNNDVTGNWRVSIISANINVVEYILNYYKEYIKSNQEVHAIINLENNTTTRINVFNEIAAVTVLKHTNNEETDAKKLFGGQVLEKYTVNLDTGFIAKYL